MKENKPSPDNLDYLFTETDPKKHLEESSDYDASHIAEKINSTSSESSRKWVRKSSFLQLGYALEGYQKDYAESLTPEQNQAITEYMDFAFSEEFQQQDMTKKEDIEKAIEVLEIIGFDVSVQREQLEETWE